MADQYALTAAWATKKITNLASVFGANLTPGAMEIWVKQVLKIVGLNDEIEHSTLGRIRPGEWLFDYWATNYERFPKPVQLRRIYGRYWKPADGVEVLNPEVEE